MPKFARPNMYNGRQSNQAWTGSVRAANPSEAAAGDSEQLYISPATLAGAVQALVPHASDTEYGIVVLTDDSEPVATKVYVDNIAIAGAPDWSESVKGIGELSTQAEAIAGTNDDTAMTPLKVAQVFAGGTVSPSFTNVLISGTLGVTGLTSLNGSATVVTGATALNLGADAGTGAVNIGTGAAARTITMGNISGATALALNSGTGGIALVSTTSGDITIASADTCLIDCAGVLELNSSAGVIGIGNDAVAQNINIGTGAAARTITVGNASGATSVVINAGTGPIEIGANAIAHSITVGNDVGATAIVLEVGTGNFVVDGVGASEYEIGASTTTGTILIGGTAQTGAITLGSSSGTNAVNIGVGAGATTVNIATGATNAKAVNIGTGAVANVIAVGSSSAGAITVDTAAGVSVDGATASNFTVTGAGQDLTLASVGGSVKINSTENAAGAIALSANGGTSETITIAAAQGTGAASIGISSTAGGVTISGGLATADAINLSAATGGVDVDSALQINIASSQAAANAIALVASDAGGGITIAVGTGGVGITGAVDISLDARCRTIFADGDEGTGIATTTAMTNGTETTQGAGELTIVSTNANNGDNAGFLKFYVGASVVWVPYFTNIAPS